MTEDLVESFEIDSIDANLDDRPTSDIEICDEDRKRAPIQEKSIQNIILPCITAVPKYIPHWYIFDTLGSELYDNFAMKNPYYHIYWAEKFILNKYAEEICASVIGSEVIVSELGAGSFTKTVILLEVLLKNRKNVEFTPIDVAKDFMEESAKAMRLKYNQLTVTPFVGDYTDGIRSLKSCSKPVLLLFFGSSFGNIPLHSMISFLSNVKNSMKEEDRFVIGIDLTRNIEKLKKAYTQPASSVPFYKNMLTRLNHDFDADFNLEDFVVHYDYVISNDTEVYSNPHYVQLSLRALKDLTVPLRNVEKYLTIKEGEKFYSHELENLSIKWSWQQFIELIEKAGFRLENKWTDQNSSYGVACIRLN